MAATVVRVTVLAASVFATVVAGLRAIDPEGFEIAVEPSEIRWIETSHAETVIRGRPYVPYARLATLGPGTRLAVRGTVASRDEAGCRGKPWYAVQPFGFVCSVDVRKSSTPPSLELAPQVEPGRRLPYRYAHVSTDHVPVYPSGEAVRDGLPAGLLAKGMSLAVDRSETVHGDVYLVTTSGKWVARNDVRWLGEGSEWQGVRIEGEFVGPSFGWISRDDTPVRSEPSDEATVLRKLKRRTRVPLLERGKGQSATKYWRVGDDAWVTADRINEVVLREPPEGVTDNNDATQWIDVDTGEQVLVAYRGRRAVFATLISSGRAHPTPLGNYPIWAKVTDMKMGNQAYEDNAYLVEGVPWVLLFQGHNALHGAYWHDQFGIRKSHGCVNLSPRDARWVFEWTLPVLLEGWTGFLPPLEHSVTVHVRDSHQLAGKQFIQERPVGPPDREAEQLRLEEAEERRAEEAPPPVQNEIPTLDGLRRMMDRGDWRRDG